MDILKRAVNSDFKWSRDLPNQWEIVCYLEKDKKAMYRGARFWYLFRKYLPYGYGALFLTFMILVLTKYRTVEANLALGSLLSLLMSSSVVASYIMIIPWRKHPSNLVLYRALTTVVLSLTFLFEALATTNATCQTYAVATQFSVLAGECWLTTIALDLVYSLTNPFISYKSNLKKYHIMVWLFTGLITFIFYWDTSCQGEFDQGICWVSLTSTNSPCLWGYFLFWVVCMYVYQVYASAYAYFRLKKGLPATFEVRKKCAQDTFTILIAYAAYLSFLVLMFSIISSDPSPKKNSGMANFALFYLFLLSNKGSVDGIIWFYLHDFPHEKIVLQQLQAKQLGLAVGAAASSPTADEEDGESSGLLQHRSGRSGAMTQRGSVTHLPQMNKEQLKKLEAGLTQTITELADLAIAEFDETDLSPQVNMALRTQIVQYVTMGVRTSVLGKNLNTRKEKEIAEIMDTVFDRPDPAVIPGLEVVEFQLDKEHPFKAFAPSAFRQLRQLEGIDDRRYVDILSASANERLSEGASGAFMFFCGGGEFIVKTIRAREATVLHRMLPTFLAHIQTHPESMLCRFLGSYSLKLYAQTFYFVVMLNCFDPHAYINERFDLKGSWVGRSAEPAKKTKKVVCRHCNEYFIPAKQESCAAIVGPHEANVVLKDNDLRTKISLPPDTAQRVLTTLKQDSDLLGKLGVLDYSLLVGVKKWKFGVEITPEMVAFNSKRDSGRPAGSFEHKGPVTTFTAHTVTGPAVYHFGIIDFLQNWTFSKQLERNFKIYVLRKDADGLSVMHPVQYMKRFQAKLEQIFDLDGSMGGIGAVGQRQHSLSVSLSNVAPTPPPRPLRQHISSSDPSSLTQQQQQQQKEQQQQQDGVPQAVIEMRRVHFDDLAQSIARGKSLQQQDFDDDIDDVF